MAKPKPKAPGAAGEPAQTRFLAMELRAGDRLADETAEWEIIGRPYTTAAGKDVNVRVQRVDSAAVTMSLALRSARVPNCEVSN